MNNKKLISKNYYIAPSRIHGRGLFANKDFSKGELIGLAHVDNQPTPEIGNFHNHDENNPTAINIKKGNQRYLLAGGDIKAGTEITTNYRMQPELGQPEEFMTPQKDGYRSYSPFQNLPYIDVNSNVIDTNNLAYDKLKLIGDNGIEKIVKNNSGNVTIPGAETVREIPLAQDGGTIEEQVYSMFPALQNMGEVTFKADPEFTREVTGVGDIEYFSPKRNRTQITYPNSFVYQHPKPGTHGIVYNPETNNAQSIALDMLHGLSKDDNKYNRLRNKFKRKFLTSKFKDDVERDWERKLEEEGKGDGKSHFINNHIDGVIRNLLFEGAPEDFENYRYWPEARDTYLDTPEVNESFTELETYLKTPIKQEGGEYEELELTDEEIEEYRRGGHVVEELPKAQPGKIIKPVVNTFLKKYHINPSGFTNKLDTRIANQLINDVSHFGLTAVPTSKGTYYLSQDGSKLYNLAELYNDWTVKGSTKNLTELESAYLENMGKKYNTRQMIEKYYKDAPVTSIHGSELRLQDYPQEISEKLTGVQGLWKPEGLWYGKGNSWRDWAQYEMPEKFHGSNAFSLDLNYGHGPDQVVKLTSPESVAAFTDAFGKSLMPDLPRPLLSGIDWPTVANRFGGVEISPYRKPETFNWSDTWDVDSGAIWNKRAIKGHQRIPGINQSRPEWDFQKGGDALSNKISKLHREGYTADGQAYAIAKNMGYAQGGELPKAQPGGLGKKLPGYTLAEIKVAGLNRNMFKHPQTGDIRFEPIPYTQLHPQAFQFNVGDKKYWEFQEDMGKAMLSLKGDKGFPDFNWNDYITHRTAGFKGKPNDLTDFAQKKIKEILLEKGWTNDDILKYSAKNLELRLDPKYGKSVVGAPKFNFLSERGVTPMSDWHFQGSADWPKVQPGTSGYLSDPIRGLGDIDYLSNTVTLGPDVVPWAGGNTPGGLWNKLNNLDIPYEEKVKRFGEHIMKMKNNVDFSGQQKLYGDAFKRQFPIELHDGAHPNPINNQLFKQLRNAYKLNKEGGELPKAQPGKEVGKRIFQRFVKPPTHIVPPIKPLPIIPYNENFYGSHFDIANPSTLRYDAIENMYDHPVKLEDYINEGFRLDDLLQQGNIDLNATTIDILPEMTKRSRVLANIKDLSGNTISRLPYYTSTGDGGKSEFLDIGNWFGYPGHMQMQPGKSNDWFIKGTEEDITGGYGNFHNMMQDLIDPMILEQHGVNKYMTGFKHKDEVTGEFYNPLFDGPRFEHDFKTLDKLKKLYTDRGLDLNRPEWKWKEGGDLPKAQPGGGSLLPKFIKGFTPNLIKSHQLNLGKGLEKFYGFEKDLQTSLFEMGRDPGMPDFNTFDAIGWNDNIDNSNLGFVDAGDEIINARDELYSMTDFAFKDLNNRLKNLGHSEEDIAKYFNKSLELRKSNELYADKFNMLRRGIDEPSSNWYFPSGKAVERMPGVYRGDQLKSHMNLLGDIEQAKPIDLGATLDMKLRDLSDRVNVNKEMMYGSRAADSDALWKIINEKNPNLSMEEKVKVYGKALMNQFVDLRGRGLMMKDDGNTNLMNKEQLQKLSKEFNVNKYGGVPKAQPGKEVGKRIFQRFVNPFTSIKPPRFDYKNIMYPSYSTIYNPSRNIDWADALKYETPYIKNYAPSIFPMNIEASRAAAKSREQLMRNIDNQVLTGITKFNNPAARTKLLNLGIEDPRDFIQFLYNEVKYEDVPGIGGRIKPFSGRGDRWYNAPRLNLGTETTGKGEKFSFLKDINESTMDHEMGHLIQQYILKRNLGSASTSLDREAANFFRKNKLDDDYLSDDALLNYKYTQHNNEGTFGSPADELYHAYKKQNTELLAQLKQDLKNENFRTGPASTVKDNAIHYEPGFTKTETLEEIKKLENWFKEYPDQTSWINKGSHRILEPLPHLRELRTHMFQDGVIKNFQDDITTNALTKFWKTDSGKQNRILSFMQAGPDQINGLVNLLNRTPVVAGALGVGSMLYGDNDELDTDRPEWDFKKGGEYMDLDLTEEQIQNFKDGGFVVDELPTAQYGKNINLNLSKGEKYGIATGLTAGILSSFINPKTNPVANYKVNKLSNELCTANTCPTGSTNPKDYVNFANMQLGYGEDPNRPGYFSSDDYASGNVGSSILKGLGRGALGAGAGWLTGYGGQWLGNKLAPRTFAHPGKLFRQEGGSIPSFQDGGGYYYTDDTGKRIWTKKGDHIELRPGEGWGLWNDETKSWTDLTQTLFKNEKELSAAEELDKKENEKIRIQKDKEKDYESKHINAELLNYKTTGADGKQYHTYQYKGDDPSNAYNEVYTTARQDASDISEGKQKTYLDNILIVDKDGQPLYNNKPLNVLSETEYGEIHGKYFKQHNNKDVPYRPGMTYKQAIADKEGLEMSRYFTSDKFNNVKDLIKTYHDGNWKRPDNPADIGMIFPDVDEYSMLSTEHAQNALKNPEYANRNNKNLEIWEDYLSLSDQEVFEKQAQYMQQKVYDQEIQNAIKKATDADVNYRKQLFKKQDEIEGGTTYQDLYERWTNDNIYDDNFETDDWEKIEKVLKNIEVIESPALSRENYNPRNLKYGMNEEQLKQMDELYKKYPGQEPQNEEWHLKNIEKAKKTGKGNEGESLAAAKGNYEFYKKHSQGYRYYEYNPDESSKIVNTQTGIGKTGKPGNYEYGRDSRPYGQFEHTDENKKLYGNLGSKIFHETLKKELEKSGLSTRYNHMYNTLNEQSVEKYENALIDMHKGTNKRHNLYLDEKENFKVQDANVLSDIWYGLTNPVHTLDYLMGIDYTKKYSPSDARFYDFTGETKPSDIKGGNENSKIMNSITGYPAQLVRGFGEAIGTGIDFLQGDGVYTGNYYRAPSYLQLKNNPYYYFGIRNPNVNYFSDTDRYKLGINEADNYVNKQGNLINKYNFQGTKDNELALGDTEGTFNKYNRDYAFDRTGLNFPEFINAAMFAAAPALGRVLSPVVKGAIGIGKSIPSLTKYMINPKRWGTYLSPGSKPVYYRPTPGSNYSLSLNLGNRSMYKGRPIADINPYRFNKSFEMIPSKSYMPGMKYTKWNRPWNELPPPPTNRGLFRPALKALKDWSIFNAGYESTIGLSKGAYNVYDDFLDKPNNQFYKGYDNYGNEIKIDYKEGGEYNLTDTEIENLKEKGYEIEDM